MGVIGIPQIDYNKIMNVLKIKEEQRMKWLEIIELRLSVSNSEPVMRELEALVNEMNRKNKNDSVRLYTNAIVKTDFSIHIMHESEKIDKSGSCQGISIAENLKEFALVNHNLWIQSES